MMFNLVQIAANGIGLPEPYNLGLYGPVILVSRQEYEKAGGHESVKNSVVEDVALGLRLKNLGFPFRLYIGNRDISFRMYASGLHSLLEGWIKNMATGAARTPAPVFIMVFLWITSLTSVPLQIVKFAVSMNWPWLMIYLGFYIIWVCMLAILTKRIGNFQVWALIFYPLLMLVFLGIIVVSTIKKLLGFKVTWKGRAI